MSAHRHWEKDVVLDHWISDIGTITLEGLEYWHYPEGAKTDPRGGYDSLDEAKHHAERYARHLRERAHG